MFEELLRLVILSLIVTEVCLVKMLHEYSRKDGNLKEAILWGIPTAFSGAMLVRFIDALLHG